MPVNRCSLPDSSTNVLKLSECYEVGRTLGSGRYGVVKECTHKRNGQQFAGKFLKRRRSRKIIGQGNEVQNEIDILKSLKHPSIIQLFEVFETPLEVVLILDLVTGGELFDYLTKHNVVKEEEVVCFIRQLLKALEYMHGVSVVHMDLKPENIVLKDTITKEIKLIDFGLSRKLEANVELRELTGTPEFVAPEVVNFDPLTCAVDMWSVGVITYVMISGNSPFMGDSPQETLSNVSMGAYDFEEFGEDASDISKDFINSLLRVKPRRRMTAIQSLNHPWIEPRNENEIESRRRSRINMEKLISFVAKKKWKQSFHAVSIYNHLLHKALQKAKERNKNLEVSLNTDSNDEDDHVKSIINNSDLNTTIGDDNVAVELSVGDDNIDVELSVDNVKLTVDNGGEGDSNPIVGDDNDDVVDNDDVTLRVDTDDDLHVIKAVIKGDVLADINHGFRSVTRDHLKTANGGSILAFLNAEVKVTEHLNDKGDIDNHVNNNNCGKTNQDHNNNNCGKTNHNNNSDNKNYTINGDVIKSQNQEESVYDDKTNKCEEEETIGVKTSLLTSKINNLTSKTISNNDRILPKLLHSKSHFITSTSAYLSHNVAPLTPPILSFSHYNDNLASTFESFIKINMKPPTIKK